MVGKQGYVLRKHDGHNNTNNNNNIIIVITINVSSRDSSNYLP